MALEIVCSLYALIIGIVWKRSYNPVIVGEYTALSDFTFNAEFITVEDNGIADSISCLRRYNMSHNSREYPKVFIVSPSVIERLKLTKIQ